MSSPLELTQIPTFAADGRRPLTELYAAYSSLVRRWGWQVEVVFSQSIKIDGHGSVLVPMVVLTSPQPGPALWVLSGVHGEEPAGPNALAANMEAIGQMGEHQPMVVFPLCNPWGYCQDWRYPNERRDWQMGRSVSESDYLLVRNRDLSSIELRRRTSPIALALTSKVLKLVATYQPRLTIDHHEDEALRSSYVYSQGKLGAGDPVAMRVIELLRQSGIPLQLDGVTRFDEEIVDGVIGLTPDGSVDELLAASQIMVDGRIIPGPAAQTVLVIETPTIDVPLSMRVEAHSHIIQSYAQLWSLVR